MENPRARVRPYFDIFMILLVVSTVWLLTLLIFMAFITFTAASALSFFEAQGKNTEMNSFFDSIYWALVTMFTVGYGDITPQTNEGRIVTLVLIVEAWGLTAEPSDCFARPVMT